MMRISNTAARILSFGLALLGMGVVSAQEFPSRPIRIVTSAPGGGDDFAARVRMGLRHTPEPRRWNGSRVQGHSAPTLTTLPQPETEDLINA